MIYKYKDFIPCVDPSSFVHPMACLSGCVRVGKNVYVGPFAVLRGDFGEIIIEDGCNVQEHCMIHMFPGITVHLEENVHVGHGAIIHGARVHRNCLIGMNSVIMDDVEIGEECIVGAMSFIKEGMKFPRRSLIVGNPAKCVKEVSDEMISWKSKGTELYQKLAMDSLTAYAEVEPYTTLPDQWLKPSGEYKSWHK